MSCCTPWFHRTKPVTQDDQLPPVTVGAILRADWSSGYGPTGADLFAEPEEPRIEYGRLVVIQLTQVVS